MKTMTVKALQLALLAAAIVAMFHIPADDSPTWVTEAVISKLVAAGCLAALAWLTQKKDRPLNDNEYGNEI